MATAGQGGFDANWAFSPERDPGLRAAEHRYFEVDVLDSADRKPIAGVALRTVNDVVYVSDDDGRVAYYEPGLMGQSVWFAPTRAGYDLKADGFGNRGKALTVTEGGTGEILLDFVAASDPVTVGNGQSRLLDAPFVSAADCFSIRVIDQATKRGVPLVTLATPTESFVSDSQGYIAYCDTDRLGKTSSFEVTSHGYRFEAGSIDLDTVRGESRVIEVTRENIAERLYRLTGEGIHRESVRLGLTTPLVDPLLAGSVMNQDSAGMVSFGGSLFWIWGTTSRPSYPLAYFGATVSRSPLPTEGTLDPRAGVDFEYISDANGVARGLSPNIAPTDLPTWLASPVVVPDADGVEQLLAVFIKPNPDLSLNRRGLVRFDPASTRFVDTQVEYPPSNFVAPSGEPVQVRHGARTYVYYGSPVRTLATAESVLDLGQYEVFSALPAGGGKVLERESDGSLKYGFKVGALASTAAVVSAAKLPAEQALDGHLQDSLTGTSFQTAGAVAQSFSQRRQRFIRLVEQVSGTTSYLGELWYVEADTPMGPWVYARKVVSHDSYSFSSPWFYPQLEQADGRFVFFGGTYTSNLAGNNVINTPRYNGNQLMYRLDLDDTRLALPVAVYDVTSGEHQDLTPKRGLSSVSAPLAAAFFAPDRAASDTQPVYWTGASCEARQLAIGARPLTPPLFFAYPPSTTARPGNVIPLYELSSDAGSYVYDTLAERTGFTRSAAPLAYVWPSPIAVRLPVTDYLGDLVVNAGPDVCVRESSPGAGAMVTLSGSATGPDGSKLTYQWQDFARECLVAEQAEAELRLGVGLHSFTLSVRDEQGHIASDDVIVSVAGLD